MTTCTYHSRARHRSRSAGIAGVLLLLGAFSSHVNGASALKLTTDDAPLPRDARPDLTFGPTIKKVAPSVVSIYAAKTVRSSPMFDDPMLRRFFGGPEMDIPRERRQQGLGSGVIVTADGYVLTNSHVVEGADEIKVSLADGKTTYEARVIGSDPPTDIAVIKVEASNLPAITLTNTENIQVGDLALAIGNPFGVGQTVTMGIVSATGRHSVGIVDYEDFIQTDASINPGNSGGALVDSAGRLIGINTAILSPSGGNLGIGFAVPSNLTRYVLERIVAEGKVTRGYLGVIVQPLTPELAREFGLSSDSGALVSDVTPRSPAAGAGLKDGDVIMEFGGQKITDSRQLRMLVAQTAPDTKVVLKAMRDGKEQTFNLELAELPVDALRLAGRGPQAQRPVPSSELLDGVRVDDLNAQNRQQFEIPAQIRGALVAEVARASPAAAAGLRPGDVILEINREPVADVEDAVQKSANLEGDRVLLRVWSGGGAHYVVVQANPEK